MATKKNSVPEELLPATPESSATVDPKILENARGNASMRTVDGQPIPLHLQHLIPFAVTDQGLAEAAARPGERPRCSIGAEPFEKGLAQMEDEPWLESDPFREKVDSLRQANPDKTFHMLSKNVIQKRGLRGWEVMKAANGEPEAVGGMLVGTMPKRVADRRNEKFRRVGSEALKEAEETYQVQQEKIIRDGKGDGLSALQPGEVIADTQHPGRVAQTGLHSFRG